MNEHIKSTTEREGSTTTTTIPEIMVEVEGVEEGFRQPPQSVSVPKAPLHVILDTYFPSWEDEAKVARLQYYSKYKQLIKLMDMMTVWTVTKLCDVCKEVGLEVSRTTVGNLCDMLYLDGFVKTRYERTGWFRPATVYSLLCTKEEKVDMFCERYRAYWDDYQDKKKPNKKKSPEAIVEHNKEVQKLTKEAQVKATEEVAKQQQEAHEATKASEPPRLTSVEKRRKDLAYLDLRKERGYE